MGDNKQQANSGETAVIASHGAMYDVFIASLTILSLAVMAVTLLPVSEAVLTTLLFIDTIICFIFLVDFFISLWRAPQKGVCFLKQGGWLDLLGSIPAIPILRLARLARLVRIMRSHPPGAVWADFRRDRAQSTLFVTIFVAILVITVASVWVLQVETQSRDPNIVTGSDAFWWAFVTVTTVGYGDRYPTSVTGRILAMVLMTVGVGIFGVLTSYVSSIFLSADENGGSEEKRLAALQEQVDTLDQNISSMRAQLSVVMQLLEKEIR